MHRWFFADDELFCEDSKPLSMPFETAKASSISSVTSTEWNFKVNFDWKLCCNETLAICGSCPSLGNWDVQLSTPLIRKEDSSIWTLTVSLPRENDVRYRYLVVALNCKGRYAVRFWESHFEARFISSNHVQNIDSTEYEIFGILNNKEKIQRGWLSPHITVVQFKLFQAPFIIKRTEAEMPLQIRMTPIKINARKECEKLVSPILSTDTVQTSNENVHQVRSNSFAYCEVAELQNQKANFCKQNEYGATCDSEHLLLFNMTLDDIGNTAYLIDIYGYSPKSGPDVPPNHFGYQYVLPQALKKSEGTLELIIMCATKHRPIGFLTCDYLVVKPIISHDFNLEKTFQRHWNSKHETLHIGHRGYGSSFWWQTNIVRENTIHSFNLAIEHGADMVEFDVQLTKDMVPIVWHDFEVYTSISEKISIDPQEYDIMYLPLTNKEMDSLKSSAKRVENNLIAIPLSRFTLEQLERVKIYEPAEDESSETMCSSDTAHHQPFITLEQVFKEVGYKTGFIIDIKWPERVINDTKPDFDKNEFVDAILRVILKLAGFRRIIFSSFDADICSMVRFKQNLYPTLFLIQDYRDERKSIDPRGNMASTGINFANAMELLGIVVNYKDLLKMPGKFSDINGHDFCLFCWGIEICTEEMYKHLKKLGVNAILYDRIDHALQSMNLKGSIFYIVPFTKSLENIHKKLK